MKRIFMRIDIKLMNYNLEKVINERLKNRLEWLSYLDWLITHRKLHKSAKDNS